MILGSCIPLKPMLVVFPFTRPQSKNPKERGCSFFLATKVPPANLLPPTSSFISGEATAVQPPSEPAAGRAWFPPFPAISSPFSGESLPPSRSFLHRCYTPPAIEPFLLLAARLSKRERPPATSDLGFSSLRRVSLGVSQPCRQPPMSAAKQSSGSDSFYVAYCCCGDQRPSFSRVLYSTGKKPPPSRFYSCSSEVHLPPVLIPFIRKLIVYMHV